MEPVLETDGSPLDVRDFKTVLGRFCTGVTVITARAQDGPVGFTCQSFSALSLEPPAVCFCPARTSTSWPRLREVGRFCVNILALDQQEICGQLARSGTDKFAGVDWEPSPNGSPRLAGTIAWLDCELEREVDGGGPHHRDRARHRTVGASRGPAAAVLPLRVRSARCGLNASRPVGLHISALACRTEISR